MHSKAGGIRAAIYTRISKDAEALGLGVERQREDCEKLCAARGWPVHRVYTDNDKSAYSGKPRPEYMAMMDALAAGEVQAIVAYHPDRLHRSPKELEAFIDAVEAAHADVATVQGGDYDLSTATGRMAARIVGAVARAESERISEKVQRTLLQNAERGVPHGGIRKFGYKQQDGNGLVIDEDEAAVIRDCVQRILNGQSLVSVVAWLNETGVKTPTGATFKPNVLKRILLGKHLIGVRVYGPTGVEYPAEWPAILERGEQLRLEAILNHKPGTTGNAQPWKAGNYLLSGLLRCGNCGAKLVHIVPSKKADGTRRTADRYACPGKAQGGCNSLGIKQSDVDGHVYSQVYTRLRSIAVPLPAEYTPAAPDTTRMDTLKARRQEYLQDVELAPADLKAMLQSIDAAIEAEQATLGATIVDGEEQRFIAMARDTLSKMSEADWLEMADVEYQRSVIGAVTERITVLPTTRRGGRSTVDAAERVTIVWRTELPIGA